MLLDVCSKEIKYQIKIVSAEKKSLLTMFFAIVSKKRAVLVLGKIFKNLKK